MFWSQQPILHTTYLDFQQVSPQIITTDPISLPSFPDSLSVTHDLSKDKINIIVKNADTTVASMTTRLHSCQINEQTYIVGHLINLWVHEDHRKLGIGQMCIQQTRYLANLSNIFIGYFLSDRHISANAIKINRWCRPLNVKKCIENKLNMPLRLPHKTPQKSYAINEQKNMDWVDTDDIKQLVKLSYNYVFRTDNLFNDCIKKTIRYNDYPIAYIGYNIVIQDNDAVSQKNVGSTKQDSIVHVTYFFGSRHAFQYCLSQLSDHIYLTINQTGQCDKEFLQSVQAFPISSQWLNYYNWTGYHKANDLSLPL